MNIAKFYFFLGFIFSVTALSGQLFISEYSASNLNQFEDTYGRYEDWVEIYNESDVAIDLSGYALSDKESKPRKWVFPDGIDIQPDSYMVIYCSGRDTYHAHEYHTNFKLTQTKDNEFLVLSDPSENVISSTKLELTLLGHSRVNNSSFGTGWEVSTEPTPGEGTWASTLKKAYTTAPSINQEAGFYTDEVIVDVTNNDPTTELRYTLDGTEPTLDSEIYTGPITITETTVLKARSFGDSTSVLPGKMDFKTYFINESFTLPVIAIAAEGVQDLANGQGELRPIGSIEYFNNGVLTSKSYGELNRHGQDSWVNDQRSIDWVSRDEMGYSKALNEKLFSYSDRDEYQRFMMRASGDDNYPAISNQQGTAADEDHEGSAHIRDEYVHVLAQQSKMKLDIRAVERAIVFLNGDYWGIYSPRERPVDHDYTDYTYNQNKLELQYLLTWGDTWAEYGGKESFDDWKVFRDDLMSSDMSIPENYQKVKDNMQVQGLIDYMLINLNSVCSDWINYNTGWWRGTNPEEGHTKWGYILWDNDATFDYYINYSGVPNTTPTAKPCDIEIISEEIDEFFDFGGGGFPGIDDVDTTFFNDFCESSPYLASDPIYALTVFEDFSCCWDTWDDECQEIYDRLAIENSKPDSCLTLLNGNVPYDSQDSIYRLLVNYDDYCCGTEWDADCQKMYDDITSGKFYVNSAEYRETGNVGLHEKIFLKLIDESETFRQKYYSRQADLINTTFSCESMLSTLDSLVAVIEPEMPRHIERWGRSLDEWKQNVNILREFVELRCILLDDGLADCYDLEGPYDLTLDIFPPGAGDIDLNTIEVKSFPWTGRYFGNMHNLVDADPESDYDFVRWETKSGNIVFPDGEAENTRIMLNGADTLVAIFQLESVDTDDEEQSEAINMLVYPVPSTGVINVQYTLEESSPIEIELYNSVGQKVHSKIVGQRNKAEIYTETIDFGDINLSESFYNVRIKASYGAAYEKVIFVK